MHFLRTWDGVVSIVTRLCPWRPVLQNVWTGCGSRLPPCLVGTRVLSPGIKRLGREADYSPPSNAEVKNAWSCCISAVPVCLLVVDSTSFFAHFFFLSFFFGVRPSTENEAVWGTKVEVLNSIAPQGLQDGVCVSSLPVFLLSRGTACLLCSLSRAHGRLTGPYPDIGSAISSTRSTFPIEWRLPFRFSD